jgi:hypothetical protein
MTESEFWQSMYAALMKQAHDLQEQRAGVLQQAAAIEQKFGFKNKAGGKLVIKTESSVGSKPEIVRIHGGESSSVEVVKDE